MIQPQANRRVDRKGRQIGEGAGMNINHGSFFFVR